MASARSAEGAPMTNIERQILLNQIAILETLIPLAKSGADSTRELLRQRYRETARLVREQTKG
ncbi:hypothetical protein A6X20_07110 [Bradyrhizobium elkanii]|nr:hypothetical protein A6X20_07110 [Bradyrhizobium elkanii]ODM79076.1 hypothetical protein A6452_28695 [Bradyrhizobium elkanii]